MKTFNWGHPPESEVELKWVSLISQAFEKRLSRKCVWDLSAIPSEERAPYQTAAKYYMRGVPCIPPLPEQEQLRDYPFLIQEAPSLEFESLLESSFVVCDENLCKAWPELLDTKVDYLLRNVCEANKTLQTLEPLLEHSKNFSKPWLIIGGGITCDLAAFAAHIAGAKFSLVPTSLLAMVDASFGGKTGVNFPPYGKNLVGAFAFPERVLIFVNFLQTLPEEEFYAGASECIKHALLVHNEELLEELVQCFANRDLRGILKHLAYLLNVKAEIVKRDPFEKGERAILNLGHTIAHALEAVSLDSFSENNLRHGEAVALGLVFESYLSLCLNYRKESVHKKLLEHIKASKILLNRKQLEARLGDSLNSEILLQKLCYHMQFDKKSSDSDKIPFILLSENGRVVRPDGVSYLVHVSVSKVCEVWKEFSQSYL